MFLEDVPSGIRVLIFYEAGKQKYVHNLTVPFGGKMELYVRANLYHLNMWAHCVPEIILGTLWSWDELVGFICLEGRENANSDWERNFLGQPVSKKWNVKKYPETDLIIHASSGRLVAANCITVWGKKLRFKEGCHCIVCHEKARGWRCVLCLSSLSQLKEKGCVRQLSESK